MNVCLSSKQADTPSGVPVRPFTGWDFSDLSKNSELDEAPQKALRCLSSEVHSFFPAQVNDCYCGY